MGDEFDEYSMMTIDERLVHLVQNHKIIYNKQCFGLKGIEQKQEAWNDISDQLGVTAEDCNRRWKSLRERYSRVLRQIDTHPESEASVIKDWPLFHAFSFLRPFVKKRPARTSFNTWDYISVPTTRPKTSKAICADSNESRDSYNSLEEIHKPKLEPTMEFETVRCISPDVGISREVVKVKRQSEGIQSFGQTVAAIISEMSEAKQAKAMRVLFDALITIKTEPEET